MTVIELEGVKNVRDLGCIPLHQDRQVRSGLFYRGSALHTLTESDQDILFSQLGIKRVIDLRCGWETERKPYTLPEGVEYLHIPFYDKEKVGIEYTRCAPGTRAVGKDIACEPVHFYASLTNPLTVGQIKKALSALFEYAEQGKPVYFHCSGGKDRAGITALLALTILGADRETIQDDYLFTNVARDANSQAMFERFSRFVDTDEDAWNLVNSHAARPENLQSFYQAVEENYGSMDQFLVNQLGFDQAAIDAARTACTEMR